MKSPLAAIPRVTKEFSEQMRTRFVEFYVVALGWLISSANDDWITKSPQTLGPRASLAASYPAISLATTT